MKSELNIGLGFGVVLPTTVCKREFSGCFKAGMTSSILNFSKIPLAGISGGGARVEASRTGRNYCGKAGKSRLR